MNSQKLHIHNLQAGEAAWLTRRCLNHYTGLELKKNPKIFVLTFDGFPEEFARVVDYDAERYRWFAAPENYIAGRTELEAVENSEAFAELFSTEHVICFHRGNPRTYKGSKGIEKWWHLVAFAGFNND